MKSILILIIVGLIRYSEGYSELCNVDNGRLLLMSDVKILGNITTGNSKTFYVNQTNELNFQCQKIHDTNDTKIIFNDNISDAEGQQSPANRTLTRLVNNNEGTNKEPAKIECENVCDVTIIVISFNATGVCNSNGSVNCNQKELDKELPSGRNFAIDVRIRVKGQPKFPPIIKYYIFDPAGNGSYSSCDEFDVDGDLITVGSTDGNHDTDSFKCPIDRDLSDPRPVIIKKQEELKIQPCLGLPVFCKSEIKESYFSYRYTPPLLECVNCNTTDPFEAVFPMWGLIIIILCICLVFVAIFSFYVFYNKRQNLLTLQPQKSSEFYMETPPSEPDSAKTETTLPSYHSNNPNSNRPPYDDIFDEDLKVPFHDVEKRKKLLLRQLSGDPTKVSPDLPLNAQATHLDYSEIAKNKFEIDRSKFQTGKMLGGGSYGCVCDGTAEGLFHPGHKTKVAIKTVNNELDITQLHALVCEMKVLAKLDMRLNLVNMLAACTGQLAEGQLWLLIEYCPHGDMKSFLRKNREKFKMSFENKFPVNGLDERLIIKWAHSIAKGMEYLSSKKIMHGDLAARNILIGGLEGGQENYVAKISDFGLSRTFYDDIRYKKQERDTVPWKWMDVEYLETGEFTLKSDIWSFGVVLWEILSMGQEPYVGKDIHNTIAEIKAGSRLPCPNQLEGIDWLEKFYHGATVWCWQADPNLRWSFESLVEYFETYLSEKELLEYKNFEEAYINMQDLINDDTTRLKRGPSYLKMSGAGENKASASSYSKASTVQIELQPEVQETGNGYHRFAGAQPGDGGLLVNPSDNVPGGGYITPAQAGAGGLNSTQASPLRSLSPPSNVASANVSSYITMPQAMCQ